jgi:hypothetical protein
MFRRLRDWFFVDYFHHVHLLTSLLAIVAFGASKKQLTFSGVTTTEKVNHRKPVAKPVEKNTTSHLIIQAQSHEGLDSLSERKRQASGFSHLVCL